MEITENKNKKTFKRLVSKGVFPYQWAFTLLIPLRNIFLSPRELVKRLELKGEMTVMELGPGPGYFSKKVAKELFAGKLVLADIQQEMLDYAKKRLSKKKVTNVEYYLCNGNNFEFTDEMFDRIYMITVIGEVENKDSYCKEFYRMLKKGGILSISEQAGDPDKLSISETEDLFESYGFTAYKLYGTQKNFTINFIK
ncbi:methyltransferase domain-containing protein [Apibacter raozihei]|uniref:class I SAM-dependent methyltransferase n=1 Tax=Apibacter raozihei TaxID=2500547 RepID=UPI000FE39758|nr:methyltransferase domain-containing protein [Apibacter raozihei]